MTNAAQSKDVKIPIYLGLGSNVGDRAAKLREAIERIQALGLEIKRESSVYETEPVGFRDQPWFLNQVIETWSFDELISEHGPVVSSDPEAKATIQGEAVLSELLKIEQDMGRERAIDNGPRVIDIDLLLFGDKIIAHAKDDEEWPYIDFTDIFVPHPRMHMRRFVLEPLCEIAPDVVHPTLKKTCRELLASLEDDSQVRLAQLPSKQR
jgi:2-amino-4-hydroxy-6-hydroxymethyldihydropteridine diphosphokinase